MLQFLCEILVAFDGNTMEDVRRGAKRLIVFFFSAIFNDSLSAKLFSLIILQSVILLSVAGRQRGRTSSAWTLPFQFKYVIVSLESLDQRDYTIRLNIPFRLLKSR